MGQNKRAQSLLEIENIYRPTGYTIGRFAQQAAQVIISNPVNEKIITFRYIIILPNICYLIEKSKSNITIYNVYFFYHLKTNMTRNLLLYG